MEKLHEIYIYTLKLNKNRLPSDSSRVVFVVINTSAATGEGNFVDISYYLEKGVPFFIHK